MRKLTFFCLEALNKPAFVFENICLDWKSPCLHWNIDSSPPLNSNVVCNSPYQPRWYQNWILLMLSLNSWVHLKPLRHEDHNKDSAQHVVDIIQGGWKIQIVGLNSLAAGSMQSKSNMLICFTNSLFNQAYKCNVHRVIVCSLSCTFQIFDLRVFIQHSKDNSKMLTNVVVM